METMTMTFSNGTYSPHPCANPFNTRLGPSNFTYNKFGVSYRRTPIRMDAHATLPDSSLANYFNNN